MMRLDDCLSVRGGRLHVEECDATELARRFGTPFYVHSEGQLRRNARRIRAAFEERWPEGSVHVLPSIKANLSLALRQVLNEEGLGCDVFGEGELEAALRTGIAPELVSLNGTAKSPELVDRAVRAGVRVTLDSVAELDAVRAAAREASVTARVRFRVRPDLRRLRQASDFFEEPVAIADAADGYKPGIPTEQLLAFDRAAALGPEIDPTGLMVHVGRHGTDPDIWRELARELVRIAALLREAWAWEPAELDVGGGFPTPRDPTGRALARRADAEDAPPIEAYAEAVTASLREALLAAGMRPVGKVLEVEPGRALYADTGIHLATVLNVKEQRDPTARTWVETDTSEIFLADLAFEHVRWRVIAAGRADAPADLTADVVGRSCNFDVLVADARLPCVAPGDVLAFLDTGAYQDANASNFNALPRPATVLVHGDEAELVKRAETVEEIFARDVVPARLHAAAAR